MNDSALHDPTQTATPVHSREALLRQRAQVFAHDQYALAGVCLYGQIWIAAALYLYDHVSTPGYLSLLLAAPFGLVLFALAMGVAKRYEREGKEESLFSWAAGRGAGRGLCLALALCPLADALLALYLLCAVAAEILPDLNTGGIALAIVGMTALSLSGGEKYALARLARMGRWGLGLALGYAAAGALPHGEAGNLFPLLGYGPVTIVKGAAWLCGSMTCCCFPLLLPQERDTLHALCGQGKIGLRILGGALALGGLTLALSAALLPVYALARPETPGRRVLLLSQASPSLLGWSLLVCGSMLLLLMGLSAGVRQAAMLLAQGCGKKEPPRFLVPVLLLILFPWAALPIEQVEQALVAFAPLRGALALGVVGALGLLSRIRHRKKAV